MSVHWHSYPTSQEAAESCAKHIVTRLEEALSGEGDATLAVSGGSTPVAMVQHLT
jgi:6-phosphogluconolactonase/glucosamine-6-phosphate isomerase/deaminase